MTGKGGGIQFSHESTLVPKRFHTDHESFPRSQASGESIRLFAKEQFYPSGTMPQRRKQFLDTSPATIRAKEQLCTDWLLWYRYTLNFRRSIEPRRYARAQHGGQQPGGAPRDGASSPAYACGALRDGIYTSNCACRQHGTRRSYEVQL